MDREIEQMNTDRIDEQTDRIDEQTDTIDGQTDRQMLYVQNR